MIEFTEIIDIFKLKKEIVELEIKEYEIKKLVNYMKDRYSDETIKSLENYKRNLIDYRESLEILVKEFTFWKKRFPK